MRLIDADALLQEMRIGRKAAALLVQDAPTVDAEPVRRGRWEPRKDVPGFVRCSACKDCNTYDEWPDGRKWRFCPHCGARMDEEGQV